MVAVPVFGDQDSNAALAMKAGIGVKMEIIDATEEIIAEAVNQVLQNPKYTKNFTDYSFVHMY